MTWIIAGLGNPSDEYEHTRHNAGRMAVEYFAKRRGLDDWKDDKKTRAHVVRGALGKALAVCVLPNTYMNKSGAAMQHYVKSAKAAEKLIVVYDELDLPLGTIKISFDRGSGGHKGLDSIIHAVKTRAFARIRIGISPVTPSGKTKKPLGEAAVETFILSDFKPAELTTLKAVFKKVDDALETILINGREKAMNAFN